MITLREVCKNLGVSRRAVQGYEQAGLVKPTGRNARGYLLYNQLEQEKIRKIKFLQDMGFSIKEIREISEAPKDVVKGAIEKRIEALWLEIDRKENIIEMAEIKVNKKITSLASAVGTKVSTAAKKTTDVAEKSKEAVFNAMDMNGDGNIDIEDVILMAFKVPGVSINRENFLRKEFATKYDQAVIDEAIQYNPMRAKISSKDIDSIAEAIISNERIKVSGISVALGTPGGAAMAATIPADIAQYYGCMLRVAQKLLYLYGFPQIEVKDNQQTFDTETMNQIILCMGVMFGVANAKNGLLALAKALGSGVEKQLIKKALTKGTIYPIVKSISKWFGVKMTKEIFAGFFKKAIPLVGGVVGGGITYATFKPCCDKLKNVLQDTYLSNPNYREKQEDYIDIESGIEVEINEDDIIISDVDII